MHVTHRFFIIFLLMLSVSSLGYSRVKAKIPSTDQDSLFARRTALHFTFNGSGLSEFSYRKHFSESQAMRYSLYTSFSASGSWEDTPSNINPDAENWSVPFSISTYISYLQYFDSLPQIKSFFSTGIYLGYSYRYTRNEDYRYSSATSETSTAWVTRRQYTFNPGLSGRLAAEWIASPKWSFFAEGSILLYYSLSRTINKDNRSPENGSKTMTQEVKLSTSFPRVGVIFYLY